MAFKFKQRQQKIWHKPKKFYRHRYFFSQKNKLIIFFLLLFIYFIFFSKFFRIEKIDITGNTTISSEEVRSIIKNNFFNFGFIVIPGNNFFLNNEKEIENKLLSQFTEIKTIIVKKKIPNILEVKIIEKDPLIIWCRIESCYYLDNMGIAFMKKDDNDLVYKNRKFIKIIEELEISEEVAEKNEAKKDVLEENITEKKFSKNEDLENENKKIRLIPIKINDAVADKEFISFLFSLDNNIKNNTKLNIKYYKTKGVKTREIIAYTNQNTRIYFNSMDDAKVQTIYLKDFLKTGVGKDEINTLKYIYLKSGNKIFYK